MNEPAIGPHTYTLKEIAEATGLGVSRLSRFLAHEETKAVLSPSGGPPFPAECLPRFQRLADLVEAGEVTPRTAAARLREAAVSVIENRNPKTDEAPALPPQARAFVAFVVEEAVAQVAARTLPPPDDQLIDRPAAALLLCCRPRSVSRFVRPVRRGVWRRSDVLRHIAQLSPLSRKETHA